MVRSVLVATLFFVTCLSLTADAQQNDPQVEVQTSMGTIVLTLNPQAAPKTVANFLSYVNSGFYDNTIFHRVIKSFMVQGGGLNKDLSRKKTNAPVANEADNGLKNDVGTIAMARTNNPHSATAQFFINVADNAFLNHKGKTQRGWGYCVFGKVTQGMDVVRKIEAVQTGVQAGRRDVPVKPVTIQKTVVRSSAKEKKASQ